MCHLLDVLIEEQPDPTPEEKVLAILDRLEVDGIVQVRHPDPGCYGCQGTGLLRWANVTPQPCSCLDDDQ